MPAPRNKIRPRTMRDFSADHRWLSINTVTLRQLGDLGRIVDACARHGIRAIAPWRAEVAAFGVDRAARLISDTGLELSGYLRAGMLTADALRRPQARDDNRRAIDEAAVLGPCPLVVVPGGLPQYSRPGSMPNKDLAAARAMVADELAELLPYARAAGVPLALEPLHPMHAAERGCINTMRQALDVCDWLDADRKGGLGLTLDVYHVWWDPELRSQIERAGAERLLAFHVCDWLTPTRHMLNDRGMMGDGVIDIRLIRGWIEEVGYAGYVEAEIFSETWWAASGNDVIRACIAAHRGFV